MKVGDQDRSEQAEKTREAQQAADDQEETKNDDEVVKEKRYRGIRKPTTEKESQD